MALSRADKLKKLQAIEEKKRRLMKAKAAYVPHEGQVRVHKDKHSIVICASGNGFGKTTLGVQEAWWMAKGYNPVTKKYTKVPAVIAVVLDAPTKADDVWLEEAKKWFNIEEEITLRKNGRPYTTEWLFKNGSRILFMSHQQEPMFFESIQIDGAVFDEPAPRHCFIGLSRGARKRGTEPKMLIIGTPLGQPWMYNELWLPAEKGERDDVGLHRYSTLMNEQNLAKGFIERFSKNLSEKEKEARLDGHFMHLESLALSHLFSEETHVVEPFPWPKGKPVVIAIDPHFNKPHHAVMIGSVGDGRIYYIKELASKLPPTQFARQLRNWYQDYNVMDIVCDSMGNIPASGGEGNKSFSEVLREGGVRMRTTDFADKNDEDFIQRITQVLEIPDEENNLGKRVPTLAIFNTCRGIIRDIESVMWQKQRGHDTFKNKLDIANKDFLACLKYALTTNISMMTETLKRPRVRRSGRSPWSGAYHR